MIRLTHRIGFGSEHNFDLRHRRNLIVTIDAGKVVTGAALFAVFPWLSWEAVPALRFG